MALLCSVWLFGFYFTILLTYLLTAWSRVILEKLTGFQLVKKFPAFYGTRRFIPSFPRARYLSLSWVRSVQPMSSIPNFWRSVLVLSTHLRLGLLSGLFPSGLPTKTLCAPCLSLVHATCTANLILDLISRIILCEEYISVSSSLCSFLHFCVTCSLLGPNILLTPYSQTLSVSVSPSVWATRIHTPQQAML